MRGVHRDHMLLAYDYPLLSIFLSVMWFFLWVIWLMALFHVIADIFRSHEMKGIAKAAWLIFVLFLPFLGVFVYLIARGDHMAEHVEQAQRAQYEAAKAYYEPGSSSTNVADQIAQLGRLREEGSLTDADYEAAKAKVLA